MKIVLSAAVLALAVTSASVASADEPTATPTSTTETTQASAGGSASFSTSSGASASGNSSGAASSGDDPVKTYLPWIIGGLGVVQIATGIILHAAAPDLPPNCSESTRTCTRLSGQSETSFNQNQEDAGQSQQMPHLGTIAIVSGSLFVVAGVSMYFYYHQDGDKKSAAPAKGTSPSRPIVTPYASKDGAGVAGLLRF
jgi:hypothetical protein